MLLLTILAYLADLSVLGGYFLLSRNYSFAYRYNWINLGANLILIPYDLIYHATAAAALGLAFMLISAYGLLRRSTMKETN